MSFNYWDHQPPFGTRLDQSHPLAPNKACYLFNAGKGTRVDDLVQGGNGGGNTGGALTFDSAELAWVSRGNEMGLFFDNTQAPSGSPLVITSPDPGYWHDEKFSFTCVVRVTLELDAGGPLIILDIGGTTNGIALGYRSGPDTINFVVATSAGRVEIVSTTTFPINQNVKIDITCTYERGAMTLYINGENEATGSRDSSVPAHGDDPAIGSQDSDTAYDLPTFVDEWGGVIFFVYLYDWAFNPEQVRQITQNPYQIYQPLIDPVVFMDIAAAVAGHPAMRRWGGVPHMRPSRPQIGRGF